jgi:hypothetical protein
MLDRVQPENPSVHVCDNSFAHQRCANGDGNGIAGAHRYSSNSDLWKNSPKEIKQGYEFFARETREPKRAV